MRDADPIPLVTRNDDAAGSGNVVAENIAALKVLFPSIVTDGQVEFGVLRQLLGDAVEEGEERYGLNWKGKRRARAFALTPTLATLRPSKNDSKDWDTTKNIVIEGDNLEVLKCLRRSYAGQVKLIYIDPPYNTGNDFVYSDDYADSLGNYERLTGQRGVDGAGLTTNKEASGRFHTDWLNMMYPRLMLAKELLRDDGFIAISLDDNESSNLLAMMDEVFGPENYVNSIVCELNPKGRQLDAHFATSHELLHIYSKNAASTSLKSGTIEAVDASDFPLSDEHGSYRLLPLRNTNKAFHPGNRPNLHYVLYGDPTTGAVTTEARPGSVPIEPVFGTGLPAVWRWGKPKAKAEAHLLFCRSVNGQRGERADIFQKDYNSADRTRKLRTIWPAKDTGTTDSATALMKSMNIDVFQSPKPIELLRRIVSLGAPDDIVLDFFAGSGTTGHAVMAQNATDQGSRRYILVQLPEPLDRGNANQKSAANFCETLGVPRTLAELTKERLRRAGAKLKADNPDADIDTGFRVYKLATSNLKPWQPEPDNLVQSLLDAVDNILPDRTEDDLLVELLLKTGIDLTLPMQTHTICQRPVHALGGGVLIVYLGEVSDADAEEVGQGIADWHAELDPVRNTTFYFRDTGFATAAAKANVAAIIRQRVGSRVEKLASI